MNLRDRFKSVLRGDHYRPDNIHEKETELQDLLARREEVVSAAQAALEKTRTNSREVLRTAKTVLDKITRLSNEVATQRRHD